MPALAFNETGSGTPLVLLHGFPLDARVWNDQVVGLSTHARLITPDLRGFGQSRDESPFTLESLADDVHDLLHSIGALPCVLGGLSMGGYVALAFAKKHQADLSGLALIDTKAEADTDEGKKARDQMIELACSQGSKAVADKMEPRMLGPVTVQKKPQVARRLRQIMEACPALTIAHACAALRDRPDHTAFLKSIRVPTLVLVGESDAIIPQATAKQMNDAIKDSRLSIIPNAGHMAPMEQPQAVNAALLDLLRCAMS